MNAAESDARGGNRTLLRDSWVVQISSVFVSLAWFGITARSSQERNSTPNSPKNVRVFHDQPLYGNEQARDEPSGNFQPKRDIDHRLDLYINPHVLGERFKPAGRANAARSEKIANPAEGA